MGWFYPPHSIDGPKSPPWLGLITELIPEEFLWEVNSTGFSLTIMWHFFTFRDIIYFEFFRGRPLVTRKNSNYFSTNSTWMFSKMDNSPSPDSEKLNFWCSRPSFFEFWVFFAHTRPNPELPVATKIDLTVIRIKEKSS